MSNAEAIFENMYTRMNNNLDYSLNLLLVLTKSRPGALFENTNSPGDFKYAVNEAKRNIYNKHIRFGFEKGTENNPRFLITNRLLVSDQVHNEAVQGKTRSIGVALGMNCPGEMSGLHVYRIYATYKGKTANIIAEICNEQQNELYEQKVAMFQSRFPFIDFELEYEEKIKNIVMFVRRSDAKEIFAKKGKIVDYMRDNLSDESLVGGLISSLSTFPEFETWLGKNRKLLLMYLTSIQMDFYAPFGQLTQEMWEDGVQPLLKEWDAAAYYLMR